MLNEIFSKYRNDDNNEDLKNEDIDEIDNDNIIKTDKVDNQKNSDFLNEKELLTYKKKVQK